MREWFERHRADYQRPPRLSFRHVFVDPERHGDQLESRLDALAAELQAATGLNNLPEGDLLLLPNAIDETTLARVSDQFGSHFADEIEQIQMGRWSGPIESAYGMHFVFLESHTPAFTPSFDELVPELQRDYGRFLREEANRAYITGLREKYHVLVQAE